MKKALLTLAIIGLLCQHLHAQQYNTKKGYIVTQAQDTISGLIREDNDLSEKISFKPDHRADFSTYTPEDIAGFAYEGIYVYQALQLPVEEGKSRTLFLLALVEGPLSLYKGQDYFYVAKSGEPLGRLEQKDIIVGTRKREDKKYIRLLNYLTADCPLPKGMLERSKLTPPDLIRVVSTYNYCVAPEIHTQVHEEATRLKLQPGFRIGMAVSNLKYVLEGVEERYYDFQTRESFTAGMLLNLSYNDKISVQPELLITRKGSSYRNTLSGLYSQYAEFSLTYLQLPISLYYTWPTKNVRPFVMGGGVIGYTLSNRSFRNISGSRLAMGVDKDEYGYRMGAGILCPLSGSRRLGFEYTFERSLTNGIESFRQAHFRTHSISMNMRF